MILIYLDVHWNSFPPNCLQRSSAPRRRPGLPCLGFTGFFRDSHWFKKRRDDRRFFQTQDCKNRKEEEKGQVALDRITIITRPKYWDIWAESDWFLNKSNKNRFKFHSFRISTRHSSHFFQTFFDTVYTSVIFNSFHFHCFSLLLIFLGEVVPTQAHGNILSRFRCLSSMCMRFPVCVRHTKLCGSSAAFYLCHTHTEKNKYPIHTNHTYLHEKTELLRSEDRDLAWDLCSRKLWFLEIPSKRTRILQQDGAPVR